MKEKYCTNCSAEFQVLDDLPFCPACKSPNSLRNSKNWWEFWK